MSNSPTNINSISILSVLDDSKIAPIFLWYILIATHWFETGIRIFFERKKRRKYIKNHNIENEYNTRKIDFIDKKLFDFITQKNDFLLDDIIKCLADEFCSPLWSKNDFKKIHTSMRKVRNYIIHKNNPPSNDDINNFLIFLEAFLLPKSKQLFIDSLYSHLKKIKILPTQSSQSPTFWDLQYFFDTSLLKKRRNIAIWEKKRGKWKNQKENFLIRQQNRDLDIQKKRFEALKKSYTNNTEEFTTRRYLNFRQIYNTLWEKYLSETQKIFEKYKISQEIELYEKNYLFFIKIFCVYIEMFYRVKEKLIADWKWNWSDSFFKLIDGISMKDKIRTLRNDIEHNRFYKYIDVQNFWEAVNLFMSLCDELKYTWIKNDFLSMLKSTLKQENYYTILNTDRGKIRHWTTEKREKYTWIKKQKNPLSKYIKHLAKSYR